MRKVNIPRAGGYDRLEIVEAPDPVPARGQVVVRNAAVGVNYADCIVRMGLYESATKYVGWPITPGFEFAGTVVARGPDVQIELGQRVLGVTRFGGYASHVCVPEHQVFALPTGWTELAGAGFPTVFLTAWYAICELVHLRRGMRVLVHAAAGGVGGALVQIARNAGCEVFGVVGASHKVDAVTSLGATAVIDKSRVDLWAAAERLAPDGFHVVCEANGPETLRDSYEHLAPTGRLVVYGFASMMSRGRDRPSWLRLARTYLKTPRFHPLRMTNENRGVLAFNLSYLFERADLLAEAMRELLGWVRDGSIRPLAVTPFPFDRVRDAHAALESGQTVGKLVLVP
jgi:NADPH:quinone reductase-like Zn-dependent oxidoreductase